MLELYQFDSKEKKEKFAKLHQNYSVTLRVMSSTETIDVKALEAQNIATNNLAIELFPWMKP